MKAITNNETLVNNLNMAKFILSPPDILIYNATFFHFLILVRKVSKGATVLT